ncbi:MAG: hypothetical protein JEZ00_21680 [Anaerolineaceae bacterium]|nr:hypothetical protein [Anaerolineaceae bacterium]
MNPEPYAQCPIYKTKHFLFRMVEPADAKDLLSCYADPLAAPLFNSDTCTSDFVYHTIQEMQDCINFWLDEFQKKIYMRFSILDQTTQRAIGTMEWCIKPNTYEGLGKVAVLRLDLPSVYENEQTISEILQMLEENFYEHFDVDSIISKAIPAAKARIQSFTITGYSKLDPNPVLPYADYYLKTRSFS